MNEQIKTLVDLALDCNIICHDFDAKNGDIGKLNLIASKILCDNFKESIECIIHDESYMILEYLEKNENIILNRSYYFNAPYQKNNILLFVSKTKCIIGIY